GEYSDGVREALAQILIGRADRQSVRGRAKSRVDDSRVGPQCQHEGCLTGPRDALRDTEEEAIVDLSSRAERPHSFQEPLRIVEGDGMHAHGAQKYLSQRYRWLIATLIIISGIA